MAPLLALAGYGLAGLWVDSQQPVPTSGQIKLLGQCAPTENACLFKSSSLEIKLISTIKQEQLQIAAISNEAITDFSMALGNDSDFKQFPVMKSEDQKYWQLKLNPSDDITQFNKLRMAFKYQQHTLFAESAVAF